MKFYFSSFSKVYLALITAVLWVVLASCAEAKSFVASPFEVRAFHLSFRDFKDLAFYKSQVDNVATYGYNTLILNPGGMSTAGYSVEKIGELTFSGKWEKGQFAELLAYGREKGLEVIVEVKGIGKHGAIIGKGLQAKYPGLVIRHKANGILNPVFRFPDGRDAYDTVAWPMIDNFIAEYGDVPPRYMLIGIDEVPVPDLAACAEKLDTTVDRLFADLINRYTDYLLAKGITPILWGDMFLSLKLGKPGHGIHGFKHDPRINTKLNAFVAHASYKVKRGQTWSVVTSMNYIKNRDKIIMGDWQYGNGTVGGYPSIDYFQKMGFKDVWGATWLQNSAIQALAKYTADRGCRGIIATSWHTAFSPKVLHYYPEILRNSAVYQHDPHFIPPTSPVVHKKLTANGAASQASTEKKRGIFTAPFDTLTFEAELDGSVAIQEAQLLIREEQTQRYKTLVMPLTVDKNSRRLTGTLKWAKAIPEQPEFYSTVLRLVCAGNGYLIDKRQPGDFYVASELSPVIKSSAKGQPWIAMDFSKLSGSDAESGLYRFTGKHAQPLYLKRNDKKNGTGMGLNAQAFDYTYMAVNPSLWGEVVKQGLRLSVRLYIKEDIADKRKSTSIVSWGTHRSGIRVLLSGHRRVRIQIGMPGRYETFVLDAERRLPLKRWLNLEIAVEPQTAGKNRMVTMFVNGKKRVSSRMSGNLLSFNGSMLMAASEFVGLASRKNIWGHFPGYIEKIELKPY